VAGLSKKREPWSSASSSSFSSLSSLALLMYPKREERKKKKLSARRGEGSVVGPLLAARALPLRCAASTRLDCGSRMAPNLGRSGAQLLISSARVWLCVTFTSC
jgi:hypothetical protein